MLRLSREQVRTIDRLAIEKYLIPGEVLMENAARGLADVAWEMLDSREGGEVLIICGGGNNGGDGLAAARHLHNRGANVKIIVTADPKKYSGEAKTNWQIVRAMNLPTFPADKISQFRPRLMIDAIFGTGLTQPPRDQFAQIAGDIEKVSVPILAVDIPSGLDCDTGKPLGPICIKATRTVTFVAEKVGFASPAAAEYLGQITVADIGCPRELILAVAGRSA